MQACKPRGLDNKFIALSEDAASPIIGFWPLLFSNNGDQLNGYVHCPQCRTSEEKSDAAPAPRMPCSYQPVHARIWTAGFTPECPLRSLSKNPLSRIRQSKDKEASTHTEGANLEENGDRDGEPRKRNLSC